MPSRGRVAQHGPLINSGAACEARVTVEAQLHMTATWMKTVVGEDERAGNAHNPRPRDDNENRADESVMGYWKRGRECLFDV